MSADGPAEVDQEMADRIGNDEWGVAAQDVLLPIRNLWDVEERRKRQGPPSAFSNSTQLMEAILGYFRWNEANPLYQTHVATYQGEVTLTSIPKRRAMSRQMLCAYIGLNITTWMDFRDQPHLADVHEWAENMMRDQKFTSAAADLMNPMIIARDIGLKEQTQAELGGVGGGPLQIQETMNRDADAFASRILSLAATRSTAGTLGLSSPGDEGHAELEVGGVVGTAEPDSSEENS